MKKKTACTLYEKPMPRSEISKPESAGAVLRAILKTTALSPIALVKFFAGTVSEIIAAREGCRKTCTQAIKKAVTYTCHGSIRAVKISTAVTAYKNPFANCAPTT